MAMNSALRSIIFVTVIGYLGTAMPYPIFAPLFIDSSAEIARSDLLSPIWLFSLLMAIYPAGTLIGSVYLGQCSDRVGRRKVILVSLIIAVAANALAGYAVLLENYALLFLARFITGFCEGNISVARAMLIDLDLKSDKAVAFGYLSSAGYTGYLVGPLLGAYLSYLSFAAPFILAAGLCVLAAAACVLSLPPDGPTVSKTGGPDPVSFWREPGLKIFLAIQLMITVSINIYHEFFPALMVEKWQASPQQISYATIIATVTMIMVSVVGIRPILRRWDTTQLYFSSMLMIGLSLALFAFPTQLLAVYPLFVLFGVSLAIFNSSSNTWLSDTYASTEQGKLMGVVGSMFFLANIAAALLGGLIANFSITALMASGGVLAILSGFAFRMTARRLPVERQQ